MAKPNCGILVDDPVLSKKPPQERPDNGRSAAIFMATYDGNPISIINEGSSNMAGRSHLEITLPWQISTPGARIREHCPDLHTMAVKQSNEALCLPSATNLDNWLR